jgi:hypothetical protein
MDMSVHQYIMMDKEERIPRISPNNPFHLMEIVTMFEDIHPIVAPTYQVEHS